MQANLQAGLDEVPGASCSLTVAPRLRHDPSRSFNPAFASPSLAVGPRSTPNTRVNHQDFSDYLLQPDKAKPCGSSP